MGGKQSVCLHLLRHLLIFYKLDLNVMKFFINKIINFFNRNKNDVFYQSYDSWCQDIIDEHRKRNSKSNFLLDFLRARW